MRKETYWCDACGSVLDTANPRYVLSVKEANGHTVYRDCCGDCFTRIMQTYFPERSASDDNRTSTEHEPA